MSDKLKVMSPLTGKWLYDLDIDNEASLNEKVDKALNAQNFFKKESRQFREELLISLATAIELSKDKLASDVNRDSGKAIAEAIGEVNGSINAIKNTISQTSLPELDGMIRIKERLPVGVVGLITSFNFPLAVAFWTIAPAILAGNAVVWKPSKSTPTIAISIKRLFDKIAGEQYQDLLQILISERGLGNKLVAHEHIDMISATGSVEMGESIKKTLTKKLNNVVPPILELGGNNGVIISEKMSAEHLGFSVGSIIKSFFGSNGQRCTNARRLIVQRSLYDSVQRLLQDYVEELIDSDIVKAIDNNAWDSYGYSALINKDAYLNFHRTRNMAKYEGGSIYRGERLATHEDVYVVEPCLAFMNKQTDIMSKECFAPLLFVVPYDTFDEALEILNAPQNAGLVAGLYTQNQSEVDSFIKKAGAGHILVNSPKGTGTPAYGMGFGGNRDSGEGEILNSSDPLLPFTKPGKFSRIAINSSVIMDK